MALGADSCAVVLGVLSVLRGVLSLAGFSVSVLGAVCVAVFGLLSVRAVFSPAAGFALGVALLPSEVALALCSEVAERAGALVLLAAVPLAGFSPRVFAAALLLAAPLPVAPL